MSTSKFRSLMQSRSSQESDATSVLIIGLGRFGSALAETLIELGTEVLAIDSDSRLVQEWAPRLTHVREADATSSTTLRQLGASEFDVAVVAIGSHLEASILATAALIDVGVKTVWAKAVQEDHGRILERIGAHHVVYPERDMGKRVAHAVSGRVVDYFQLDEGFALAEVKPPRSIIGKSLTEANIRAVHDVTIVCVKPLNSSFTYATPDTVIREGDLLVVAGGVAQTEDFAATD